MKQWSDVTLDGLFRGSEETRSYRQLLVPEREDEGLVLLPWLFYNFA